MDDVITGAAKWLRRACRRAVKAGEVVLWAIALVFLSVVVIHSGFLGYVGLEAIVRHITGQN